VPSVASHLEAKLANRDALVGIVGLGYVGLPLALTFTERGFRVLGFDVDAGKVADVNAGKAYIKHVGADRLARAHEDRRLSATEDFERLGEPDAVLICVPTPLTRQREPDLRFVEETARRIAKTLREGQLVVLESTTYPGTTDELVRAILDGRGLRLGEGYFLAFSPEREDPGNRDFTTATIPKVVGGVDATSGALAATLYEQAIEKVVRVSSARTAEAAKLTENIYRAVNIALVNELKVIYDRMGIDVWEVLDAASTKPFGFKRFDPGPGWGGHCIPLDPVQMPAYVVDKLVLALNDRGKAMRGSDVLVLGLAYKKDIDDPRESPAFEIFERLLHLGARVQYHDPHIPNAPRMRSWPAIEPMASIELTAERLRSADAVLLVTDHSSVDYPFVLEHAQLIVDTRGVYRAASPKVVKA
jgi:UDP-N-acetyl-D-glucosamine dehydrogenase